MIFILRSEGLRAIEVFRRAVNVEGDTGEGIFKPLFDQRYGEVSNVNAGPATAKFLGSVNGSAATAEWVKDNIAFI